MTEANFDNSAQLDNSKQVPHAERRVFPFFKISIQAYHMMAFCNVTKFHHAWWHFVIQKNNENMPP